MAAFENEKNQVNQSKRQKNSDLISCCLIEINNELFLNSDFYQEKNYVNIKIHRRFKMKIANINLDFKKLHKDLIFATELKKTTLMLYVVLLNRSASTTHDVIIYIGELANEIEMSSSTVRRHMNKLIELGLVERIEQKSPHNPKMNLANRFVVHDFNSARYLEKKNGFLQKKNSKEVL